MMQVIDEDYVRGILALPDGTERLTSWVHSLIDQRDTAEKIAKACVDQLTPLQKRVDGLLEANNRLVLEKRDLRFELTAETDAMAAELDEHRRNGSHDFLEVAGSPEEAAQLLAWFDDRHDLDLAYKYDLEPGWIPKHLMKPGPIPEEGWCVHQERGGRNDREWTMISLEATPIDALREAHKAFCDGR